MNRKEFLITLGAAILFTACSKADTDLGDDNEPEKVLFRFAIASDIHYGESNTNYSSHITNLKSNFQSFNKEYPCDFIVLNGDIIHNDPVFLQPCRNEIEGLHNKIYVTQGNHDRVSDQRWKEVWGCDMHYDVVIGDAAFIFGTTSDAIGSLKCPDLTITESYLEKHKSKKHVFIFWHIHPHYADMGCTGVSELLSKYSNVRGVFNGHDHNDESIKTINNIPYIFNGRVAGSWGSFDRNFRVVEVTNKNIVTYLMTPVSKKRQTTIKL